MNLRPLRQWAAVALVAGSALTTGLAHAAYQFTEITRAGATTMALWDVNNAGVMVGYSVNGSSTTDFAQGFVFDGTAFTSMSGPAGAVSTNALGISDSGQVVGSYSRSWSTDPDTGDAVLAPSSGFVYQAGTYSDFAVAGAVETVLRGISPNGRYYTGYYNPGTGRFVGFVYDTVTSTRTDLSVPNSLLTIPQGVRDDGTVVGSDIIGPGPLTRPGFIYDPVTGLRTDQNIAGSFRTAIRAITDDDFQSGWFYNADRVMHGFVGTTSSYEQIDFAGADMTYIEGNNNARWLVGGFTVGDTTRAFLARPIAEPGTAALLALGLAALALRKRR